MARPADTVKANRIRMPIRRRYPCECAVGQASPCVSILRNRERNHDFGFRLPLPDPLQGGNQFLIGGKRLKEKRCRSEIKEPFGHGKIKLFRIRCADASDIRKYLRTMLCRCLLRNFQAGLEHRSKLLRVGQRPGICCECVGFERRCPRLEVLPMDLTDQSGIL